MVDLAYLLHCIIVLLAHAFAYSLGHTEVEFKEPKEQAQVETITNLALDQGKPDASHQLSLAFLLITIFMLCLIVH
jgi:hypothetical protein